METITIKYEDGTKVKTVDLRDFIKTSRRMLIDFGFDTVTEDEVERQVRAVLAGEPLNVIGVCLRDYIVR